MEIQIHDDSHLIVNKKHILPVHKEFLSNQYITPYINYNGILVIITHSCGMHAYIFDDDKIIARKYYNFYKFNKWDHEVTLKQMNGFLLLIHANNNVLIFTADTFNAPREVTAPGSCVVPSHSFFVQVLIDLSGEITIFHQCLSESTKFTYNGQTYYLRDIIQDQQIGLTDIQIIDDRYIVFCLYDRKRNLIVDLNQNKWYKHINVIF